MANLEKRIDRLENAKRTGTYCLLYTEAWSADQLENEIARLKQTYGKVIPFLVDDEDMSEGFESTLTHEEWLDRLD